MNSILQKFVSHGVKPSERAFLLEKHIGAGDSEYVCAQAIDAIEKIKDEEIRSLCQVVIRLLGANCAACDALRTVIPMLRSLHID
jgi:hypothetical protein